MKLETFGRSHGGHNARAGNISLEHTVAEFDRLTELALVEKALAGCQRDIYLLASNDHIYLSSQGSYTTRTVKVTAFITEPENIARQVRNLPKLT